MVSYAFFLKFYEFPLETVYIPILHWLCTNIETTNREMNGGKDRNYNVTNNICLLTIKVCSVQSTNITLYKERR